eukprot:RCo031912
MGVLTSPVLLTLLWGFDDLPPADTRLVDAVVAKMRTDNVPEAPVDVCDHCMWKYSLAGEGEKMLGVVKEFVGRRAGPVTYGILVNYYIKNKQHANALEVLR